MSNTEIEHGAKAAKKTRQEDFEDICRGMAAMLERDEPGAFNTIMSFKDAADNASDLFEALANE